MGKREVTILDPATDGVAEAAYFIEGKGMPETAKRFVMKPFNSSPILLMKRLNIISALILSGKTCNTDVSLIKNIQ